MPVVLVVESNPEDLMTFERLIAEKCDSRVFLASTPQQAMAHLMYHGQIDMVVFGDIGRNAYHRIVTDYIRKYVWKPRDEVMKPILVKAVSDGTDIEGAVCLYSKKYLMGNLEQCAKRHNVLCDFLLYTDAFRQRQLQPHKPEGWGRQMLRRILGRSSCAPEGSGF